MTGSAARQGLTPRARRVTPLVRLGRHARRHRWQVATAAFVCLLIGVVVVLRLRKPPEHPAGRPAPCCR